MSQLVQDGHQVMVFVHARKETVKTAQRVKEMAMEEGMIAAFETREHPKFEFYRRDIATSRNKEMKELFDSGFGIHHAGMLRTDRNMMERMFEDNAIKVSLPLVTPYSENQAEYSSRSCAAPRHSLGVSISQLMLWLSRALRCTTVAGVPLSTCPSLMCYKRV